MIPSTKKSIALKYNIKPKLAGYTKVQRTEFKNELFTRTGISEPTYQRYLNLRSGDVGDIPSGILMVISCLLDCSMLDLFNESNFNDYD
jgi:DNA-binding Xre family transcriptional regulator